MTGSIATRVGFAVRTLALWPGLFPLTDAPPAVPSLPTPHSLAPPTYLTDSLLSQLNDSLAHADGPRHTADRKARLGLDQARLCWWEMLRPARCPSPFPTLHRPSLRRVR